MCARVLAVAAELSAPPSSPSVFRDLTMFASVFRHYDVVALAELPSMIDHYARWFSHYGLWDFVIDLLPPDQIRPDEIEVEIEGGADSRLTAHNLGSVIACLGIGSREG